jgi:hypothetical protein
MGTASSSATRNSWSCLEVSGRILSFIHILTRCNVNDVIVPIAFDVQESMGPCKLDWCIFVPLYCSSVRNALLVYRSTSALRKVAGTDLRSFGATPTDLLTITLPAQVGCQWNPTSWCLTRAFDDCQHFAPGSPQFGSGCQAGVNLFELFSSPKFCSREDLPIVIWPCC